MSEDHDPRLRAISRRQFIKVAAAAAGLLAGCRPAQQPSPAPTTAPAGPPGNTPAPPDTPVPTPTSAPTTAPLPTSSVPRPEAIKMYPDGPSKVVHTHHAGVWNGENLVPEAIQQMLDASITALTGLSDATAAWAALFAPDERVAIKVNAFSLSPFWTHVPLVVGVTECLQRAGVAPEQIVIFDRSTGDLQNAGFAINHNGPGVRCYGPGFVSWDGVDLAGWKVAGLSVQLSEILLNCDALINVPILKAHDLSGISFAMKNHYGTFDRPADFHFGERIERGIAELNALPLIKDRTRLIIGDVLEIVESLWESTVLGDSILMSFDPVAHDAIGLQLFRETEASEGRNAEAAVHLASPWLANGAALGLGTDDPDHIDYVEVTL